MSISGQLWWLSFCDPERPKGTQFLGACIVSGTDMGDAVCTAWLNKVNPGGEVQGHPIPALLATRIPAERIGVLMNRETAELFDKEWPSGG